MWDFYKRAFDAWEQATASYLEQVLKSPLLLVPSGAMLSAMMKAKATSDQLVAQAWAAVGLPTRRDQERALHQLNELHSRLMDLEEQLAERR
jgi:hypothetical protein